MHTYMHIILIYVWIISFYFNLFTLFKDALYLVN